MKTYPACYQCVFRQAVTAVQLTGLDENTQIQTLKKVLFTLAYADDRLSPSAIAGETNRIIRESTGIDDFYREAKNSSHLNALHYLDDLRKLAKLGIDSLEQGIKISAAGNIMDIIHTSNYDLWYEVETTVNQELQGGGLEAFREKLNTSPHLLILADNVGETIFDRVFIETLDIPVFYAVKSGPILNDATREDALAAGIDQVAEIVETGSRAPGTILSQSSKEFQKLFQESSLVLSKGQANYETMDEQGEQVFFLLRVKCPVLADELNAPFGSLVLKQGNLLD